MFVVEKFNINLIFLYYLFLGRKCCCFKIKRKDDSFYDVLIEKNIVIWEGENFI